MARGSWRRVLRATALIGTAWAAVAVLVPWWAPRLAGSALGFPFDFPFGYWLAAQGALLCFLAIAVACVVWMERIDAEEAKTQDGDV